MQKIAITGNIASGKSTVEGFLVEMGYKVLDTDEVAHDLLKEEHTKELIIEAFKEFDILEDEELSRPKLAKIIFNDYAQRARLEAILHPLIKENIKQFFNALENREETVFVAVPLLFEAKFEDIFDKIILVYADDEIRLRRLISRNDFSEEIAKNRLNLQMSQDLKKPLVAHIIFNNGSVEELKDEVINFANNLA